MARFIVYPSALGEHVSPIHGHPDVSTRQMIRNPQGPRLAGIMPSRHASHSPSITYQSVKTRNLPFHNDYQEDDSDWINHRSGVHWTHPLPRNRMKTTILPHILPRTAALAALLLAGGLIDSSAATDKSGVIEDETWTLAMSPIRIIGDISVYSLTIQPGVEVLFTGNFEFDCPGVLHAAGNATNKIWFHGDTGITWKGLNFLNSAAGSVVDHCTVENSNDHGIAITNSSPAISNCEIKNNSTTGSGGGIYVLVNVVGTPTPSLTNCEIKNNTSVSGGGGMHYAFSLVGTAVISGCKINNNTNSSAGGGGLLVQTGSTSSVVNLTDCAILTNVAEKMNADSAGGGVYLMGTGICNLLRCAINGNEARLYDGSTTQIWSVYGGGILVHGPKASLRNCDVRINRSRITGSGNTSATYNSSVWGGGLHITSGSCSLYNCCIRENTVESVGPSSLYAGGIGVGGGTVHIENCTVLSNSREGLYRSGGNVTVLNSILYFNNSNGTQVEGSPTITYSDVQNGYTGTGNINLSPLFRADGTVPSPWPWPLPVPTSWPWPSRLSGSSLCKDAGNPDPIYNDLCFYDATTTPWGSLGTVRNDMGAYGGPGACLWEPGSVSLMVLAPTGGGLVGVGDNVTLTVQASGIGPFTYVWKKGGTVITDIPSHITGANSAALNITGATAADAGNYTVEVTNALGDMMTSAVTAVAVDPLRANVKMFAGVIVQAAVGTTVRIEYSNDLSSGSWTTLTQFAMPSSPYTYYDANSPNHPKRFYRAIEVP